MVAGRRALPVAAATALAWLGLYVHNRLELPALSLLSPENSLTLALSALLFVAWWLRPSRLTASLLLAWGLVSLVVGGVLSVLPIGLFPFEPAQTVGHYLVHLLYTLAELPLVILMIRYLRQRSV